MKWFMRASVLVFLAAVVLAPGCAPEPVGKAVQPLSGSAVVSADAPVIETLDNGATVIVKPMRAAPVVCVRAYMRAGGLYERQWLGCGLSHLVEHLVADDAAHDAPAGGVAQPAPEKRNRVTEIGGQSNAFTSSDETCYYIAASASRTAECIDLIADWIARPKFTEADFTREHGVVQRELEKGMDEPDSQAAYLNMAAVFGTHPASVPVIGLADPLSKVTFQDVLAYHKLMYCPKNTIFVVVGDIDVADALARVRKALGDFKQGRVPDLSLPAVEPFEGVRRVYKEKSDLKETMAAISFQTIPLLDDDLYALDILANIVGAGGSSRLYQSVFRAEKLVTSLSCGSWTPAWGKGTFSVDYRCDPNKADAAERAIVRELGKIVESDVAPDELERAKRQKIADWIYSQQTAEDVAATLASDYLSTGDAQFSQRYTNRIQAVSAEQVQAAAKKYLTFDRMVVTRLSPAGGKAAESTAARQRPVAKPTVFTLPSGIKVVLQPVDSGLVSMAYAVKGGLFVETKETNGLGSLMMDLSTRGSKNYTAEQIDEFFDAAGGSLSATCGNNSYLWQSTVLADNFDKAMGIFADAILRPTFPDSELDIIRPAAVSAIQQTDEEWHSQMSRYFREKFFAGSPYAMLTSGREEVAKGAGVKQIRDYYREHVNPFADGPARAAGSAPLGPGVLVVYGKFDPDKVRPKIESLFALPGAIPAARPAADWRRTVAPEGELHVLKTDKKQAAVMFGMPGIRIGDVEDSVALTVLDTIISGYELPSGWLHEELRGKQLVYEVHAYNWPNLLPGAFVAYAGCQPEKAGEVVQIIEKNLRKAASYTPTQKEIDEAVNTILTANALNKQHLGDMAMEAALNEVYGLGYDFSRKADALYKAVTPGDVLRVGRKYFSGGYVVTVTTPDPEAVKKK